jgi:hypothetical protein
MLTASSVVARTLERAGIRQPVATADAPTRSVDHMLDWIRTQFWIPERQHEPEDQRGLALDPYQEAALREACRRTEDGRFVYDVVIWSDIKKSAKSSIAAAVLLYRALHTPWGTFKVVANDLKQADSRVFYYIRRAIELNPVLEARCRIKNYHIATDEHAAIEAIPVDPKGEAGGNDDLIEFTELHAADSKASQAMWSEMTISPIKHGYSQRWVDTYAGHSGESPLLEPLYQKVVKEGQRLELPGAPADLEVFANDRLFALWNTSPRLPWQTAAYYASEAATLIPSEFARMHRNQWTTSENVFVPVEWWDGCRGELPTFAPDEALIGALDAAVSGDCFALVLVSRRGDMVYPRICHIWKPPKGGKIDFADPEATIRELSAQYNVIEWAYDPYQLHDLATRLRRDGVGWFRDFPQGADRLVADKQLYDAIRDRRIHHADNADLTEHVKNANSKADGDNKLRIVKRAEHLKIDACVALSMAHSEIKRLNVE